MKGIVKVFCVHGCIHQIQNYPDQYVNKKNIWMVCLQKNNNKKPKLAYFQRRTC